jgi:hypothetical protein
MAVNPKQKADLSKMWDDSEEAGGSGIPDGTYQFKIKGGGFKLTGNSKPCFKMLLEVVAGDEKLIGESMELNDNLETKENMGWFKSKLARLNVSIGELTFEDIENGTLVEQLKGKVFEGQSKTKGGFLNVYVNRLISESDGASEESSMEETHEERPSKKRGAVEEPEETTETEVAFDEDDRVEWNGKQGNVVEVLADEGLVRVKKDDGNVVRVKIEALSKVEGGTEETEETVEDTAGDEKNFVLPDPDDVEGLSMKEVKDSLKALDIDASGVKNPRAVLKAFSTLANDSNAKIELTEIAPLAAALEVKLTKGASFKDQLKALAKAVQAKLS